MALFGKDDHEGMRKMTRSMGPGLVDQSIRQAIQFCWMSMPAARQNARDVSAEVRRIMDRALRDLNEDADTFRGDQSDGPLPPPPQPE